MLSKSILNSVNFGRMKFKKMKKILKCGLKGTHVTSQL